MATHRIFQRIDDAGETILRHSRALPAIAHSSRGAGAARRHRQTPIGRNHRGASWRLYTYRAFRARAALIEATIDAVPGSQPNKHLKII